MMSFVAARWLRSFVGLSLLLVAATAIWAAKPAPPPPPPPPSPIKFNLKLFPTVETGTELTMTEIGALNQEGDAVGNYTPYDGSSPTAPRVYLAGTVWDANDLMSPAAQEFWIVTLALDMNNSYQVAVRAQYQGEAGEGLVQGAYYVALLDLTAGTITPILEYTLGGTVAGVGVYGMNDWGTICGYTRVDSTATFKAFVMSPGDAAPTYLFPGFTGLDAVHSQAQDINNAGQIVGRVDGKGFRYTPGQPLLVFGQVETGRNVPDWGLGRSINSTGEFCGDATGKISNNSGGWLPVAYSDGGGLVKLSTSSGPAKGINDRKDVIYQITAGGSYLLLGAENVHVNLLTAGVVQGNSAEVTRFRSNSQNLTFVNDSRVISGYFNDYTTNPSPRMAFILTPVP